MEDILKKVILPRARGFSRIEGSKNPAKNYIMGDTRQQFQDNLEAHLRKQCALWGVDIKSVLIRNITPPDEIASIIRDREVAVQTASGAAESVPYIMVTNLARAMDAIRERDIWLIGTDDAAAASLYDETLPGSVAWVLGAEGSGMRRLTRERCDALVRIPMAGQVGSLNVSVAAGVVLYETMRQRLQHGRVQPARSARP